MGGAYDTPTRVCDLNFPRFARARRQLTVLLQVSKCCVATAGFSVGEITALTFAEAFSIEAGIFTAVKICHLSPITEKKHFSMHNQMPISL